jgi:hypothetical protein
MNKAITVLFITMISLQSTGFIQAQSAPDFSQPSAVIAAYLSALATEGDSARAARLNGLFTSGGQINATLQLDVNRARHQLGTVDDFIENSKAFYKDHIINYQELERSIDYYQDLAAVNSLVGQRIVERASGTIYDQLVWMSFDMIYAKNRWYLTTVSWVNAIEGQAIEDTMLQDTLWHQPGK